MYHVAIPYFGAFGDPDRYEMRYPNCSELHGDAARPEMYRMEGSAGFAGSDLESRCGAVAIVGTTFLQCHEQLNSFCTIPFLFKIKVLLRYCSAYNIARLQQGKLTTRHVLAVPLTSSGFAIKRR